MSNNDRKQLAQFPLMRSAASPGLAAPQEFRADCDNIKDDGSDSGEKKKELHPESWTTRDTRDKLKAALSIFRMGGVLGDGGRSGMIDALEATLTSQIMSMPDRDVELMDPLLALLTALYDHANGIPNPALAKVAASGGNRHSRYAIDFKARCIVISEMLQRRGLSREKADRFVIDKLRHIASTVGLTDARGNIIIDEESPEHWRSDARRSNRKMPQYHSRGLCRSLSFRIAGLQKEADLHFQGSTARTDEDVVDAVLSFFPPISLDHLSHLPDRWGDDEECKPKIVDFDEAWAALYSDERTKAYLDSVLLQCAWNDWKATGETPDGFVVRLVPVPAAR